MVRARRLQRRHRWPGTRVRPRAHETPRLGTPPRATKWALKRLKENSHESRQIAGIRWAVGVQRCTDADDRTGRDPGEDQEYRRQSSGSCQGLRNGKRYIPARPAMDTWS